MQIDWNRIEKECPKSYEKIIDWLRYKNCIMYCDYTIRYKDVELSEFEMIYGLLEKFFNDNNIYIFYRPYDWMGEEINYKLYICYYDNNKVFQTIFVENKYSKYIINWGNINKAKLQGVYKAFEILEEKLNNEKRS